MNRNVFTVHEAGFACFFVCTNFSLQSENDKISTADELKKLGVTKPGHIARLTKAINMLPDVPFARDVPVSF